ncbi:TPA: hypothetical protein ACWRO4_002687 [Staphylococcus aureus]
MDVYIKYSSGDDSVIQNFQYLLVNSNNGNEKISKDEVSKKFLCQESDTPLSVTKL